MSVRHRGQGGLQLAVLLGVSFLSLATSQPVDCEDRERVDQRFVARTLCSDGEERSGAIRLFGESGQCEVVPLSDDEREALWLPPSGRMESMSGSLELFGNVDFGAGPEYVYCQGAWTVGERPERLSCRSTDTDRTCEVSLE